VQKGQFVGNKNRLEKRSDIETLEEIVREMSRNMSDLVCRYLQERKGELGALSAKAHKVVRRYTQASKQ